MDTVITTIQARGQITLPKKFRKELKLQPGSAVKLSLEAGKIVAKPMTENQVFGPKYSREELASKLKKYEAFGKTYWGEENDKRLVGLKKKDNTYLNW